MNCDRTKFVGASDVPAILGISRFKTPFEVWAEKTGRLAYESKDSLAAKVGKALEPLVLKWAETRLGTLKPVDTGFAVQDTPIVAHPDALTESNDVVEAKTSGIVGPGLEEWGEEHTDEVPDEYYVQTQIQMLACKVQRCYMPVLLGGRYAMFRMYQIVFDEQLSVNVAKFVKSWWENYVVADKEPPLSSPPPMFVLAKLRRVPKKVVTLDHDQAGALIEEYHRAHQAFVAAKEQVEQAKAKIIALLGDAEAATCGEWQITYFERNVKGYFVQPYSYRALQIKKRETKHE
ncbi:MAG: YqaJ viral recombinase family protein [Candidatus Caldarchaeum sp.]